ncbi:hypothetical protein [Pseudobacter ginsenosidimutans]|uniref:Uncharacterized protein n=1 Tax=Pseudobacter ginsenosidimutans TaxID=661488 RepID=A0A4Q7MLC0_9BACT|nr:hypothetical protein [Pseudobacter ginsenosidimutans]QEC40175.1 hypothetical protein FSB84_00090 [Pseudobacter ginsenosidimutans]QEC45815.1 hypothetical protein FSB84_30540 [Pseudobacter ginsenosidimutans]RZS69231.1 hypothetical protein EV199_5067 [Pseudobacter ginsenosidimutans]
MTDMLVFGFHYKQRFYKAIANIWKKSTNGLYRITVMNGDLEKLLFGNNILSLKDGRFLMEESIGDLEVRQLQQALVLGLNDHQRIFGM